MQEDREPVEPGPVPEPGSAAPASAKGPDTGGASFRSLLRGDLRSAAGPAQPQDRATLAALQRTAGNRAVLAMLRAVAPPSVEEPRRRLAREAIAPGPGRSLLAANDEKDPGPGQMRLGDFLDRVDERVKQVAEAELSGAIYRVAGCPWIDHWIGYYRGRSPEEVDTAVRRYAPSAASAGTIAEYLTAIGERVADGIRAWQATGQVPEAPSGDGAGPPLGTPAAEQPAAASPPVAANDPGATVARAGRPLEPSTRSRMGAAFGADFSGVRVHDGPEADALTRRERANALAIGRHLSFAADRYAPGTPAGDALLAHELAHVLQQTEGGPSVARLEDPALEADADIAAMDAVTTLYAPGMGRRAAPRRTAARGLQGCGGDVTVPQQAPPRPYSEIVTELASLKARKEAVVGGTEPMGNLPEIEARIEEIGQELRRMGVRLETSEIMDRLAADPGVDLMQVRGQIVQNPAGKAHHGDKLAWQAILDYVPPGRLVKYGWRWKAKDKEYWFGDTADRSSKDRVDIGAGFWSGQGDIDQAGGMEVVAYVYLGDEKQPVTTLKSGWIDLRSPHEDGFSLKSSQKVTIVDAPVTIEPAGWAPTLHEHWIDWDVDGKSVASDRFVLGHKFGAEGTHKVTAHLFKKGDTLLRSRGDHVADADIDVVVQDPEKAGEQMLAQMTGEGAPPSTKKLEESLESSIKEIERHVSEGGEQKDYWVDRLKAQRKRLAKLRENIPDIAGADEVPGEQTDVKPGHAYTGPVKAVLILPSGGGPQPLNIYLRAWQDGARWKARLVDMTSADVYDRNGDGDTIMMAYEAAFQSWMNDHPYPRGAKVRYDFQPPGWAMPLTFKCRDTAWETVKAWVDGILTVGGVVVGGLLLLTPEPTGATKALGYLFITASAARSAIAIYENMELGIDALDPRNVIEGLSILTSALGVSGSLLRQYGVRTISPLIYRVGSWTVLASLAGDATTLCFIGSEAMAQLRAVQADPTKDDAQKNAEFLRVAASLFAAGAMFFVTNKDLIKGGLKPSDFFKVDPRVAAAGGGKQPALSTGSKLDIALELRKAGDVHTAERVSKGQVPDGELLDRHAALPWMKTGQPADVAEVAKRLSPQALAAVGDKPVKEIRAALDQIADDAAVNAVAAKLKGAGLVELAPTVAQVRKLNPSSKVELLPDGQLRLDGQITLGPGKLATLGGEKQVQDFLKAVKALQEAGSLEALKLKDPAAAELIEKLGKQRWRFEHQLEKAKTFLGDMGLEKDPLFEHMTDLERERLFDMWTETPPFVDKSDTAAVKELKQAFSEYAMSRKPKTIEEFIDHFQFARSRFKNRPDELLAQFEREVTALTATGTKRGEAEKQVKAKMGIGGPDQPKDFKAKAKAEAKDPAARATVAAAETQGIKDATAHTAAGKKIEPGTDEDLKARVAAAAPIPMTEPTTAAYHVEKHHVDLPPEWKFDPAKPKPNVASNADAYFEAAAEVIRNPSSTRSVSVAQDGRSKIVGFVLEVKQSGMKKAAKQTVYVLVSPEGNATMLTYIPEKL